MAFRTSKANVAEIIEIDDSYSSIDAFILPANELVTEACSGEGFSDARLELIERWLTAHFYAMREQLSEAEGAGSVRATYQGKTGMVLAATTYGQQAMMLDTSGSLAKLSRQVEEGKKTPTVSMTWLGSEDWEVEN